MTYNQVSENEPGLKRKTPLCAAAGSGRAKEERGAETLRIMEHPGLHRAGPFLLHTQAQGQKSRDCRPASFSAAHTSRNLPDGR